VKSKDKKKTTDELSDLVYNAVMWPENRLIGNHDMQIFFGCDPGVVNFFEARFLTDIPPDDENPHVFPAKRGDWIKLAKEWAKTIGPWNETNLKLH